MRVIRNLSFEKKIKLLYLAQMIGLFTLSLLSFILTIGDKFVIFAMSDSTLITFSIVMVLLIFLSNYFFGRNIDKLKDVNNYSEKKTMYKRATINRLIFWEIIGIAAFTGFIFSGNSAYMILPFFISLFLVVELFVSKPNKIVFAPIEGILHPHQGAQFEMK